MRRLTIVAIVITAMFTLVPSNKVEAQSFNQEASNRKQNQLLNIDEILGLRFSPFSTTVQPLEEVAIKIEEKKPEEPKPEKKPEPVVYKVVEGDNLTKIAKAHNTKWERIWEKNEKIQNQDMLEIGVELIIPLPDEVLEARPIQEPVLEQTTLQTPQNASNGTRRNYSSSGSAGNTYGYGYCTWYAKNRRPDLPNSLGNANTWYYRASAMGLSVGSTPRVGAVATTTAGGLGHVAIVESVNGDGTVRVSEMNYEGWNIVSSRTANASSFLYIY